jgi:hypothetical protein
VPDPYRVLFPIGIAFALAGSLIWPIHSWWHTAYPGIAHQALMIEGYQISFVLGFLLTAMVGFLRNPRRCSAPELTVTAAANVLAAGTRLGAEFSSRGRDAMLAASGLQ